MSRSISATAFSGVSCACAAVTSANIREKFPFFPIGESVVHQISTLNGSQWKGPRNQDHGNMLAVSTGYAVDRAESSDTVRHNQRANAIDSRIRIGRVRGIELVAISNPGRLTAVFEL